MKNISAVKKNKITTKQKERKIGSEWAIPDANHFGTHKSVRSRLLTTRLLIISTISFCLSIYPLSLSLSYTVNVRTTRWFYFRMVFFPPLYSLSSASVSDNRAKSTTQTLIIISVLWFIVFVHSKRLDFMLAICL